MKKAYLRRLAERAVYHETQAQRAMRETMQHVAHARLAAAWLGRVPCLRAAGQTARRSGLDRADHHILTADQMVHMALKHSARAQLLRQLATGATVVRHHQKRRGARSGRPRPDLAPRPAACRRRLLALELLD
ncbi:hypothetical protein BBN53_20930 (plasmid) [Bordetella pseudohinzii]|uniref:Uncharacterized protein n=1 Tax=Bordetella pseudohinzii TaxID=1331258 RepID=A0ABN4RXP4_9BORD|nr:hypothetical protein BBN53_20930 [Bordetella pseudohinzii]